MITQHLPFILSSSFELVHDLRSINNIPTTATLFTMDAISMYTNIDTTHAISVINNFLRFDRPDICLNEDINIDALMHSLEIIMRHNIFKFGNTYWLQTSGTAMGTPPAPTYATLYFAIHEIQTIPMFPQISFYRRYIDDCFIIWVPTSTSNIEDNKTHNSFLNSMNTFGILKWNAEPRQLSTTFLDLTISINKHTRSIDTTLFEKSLNPYLYIPQHSAHPPGVLRGLIAGMIHRIYHLTTIDTHFKTAIHSFYKRLQVRGYSDKTLLPIFNTYIKQLYVNKSNKTNTATQRTDTHTEQCVFLHMPFHPNNPPSSHIQQIFRDTILSPGKEPILTTLRNFSGKQCTIQRLIIAYNRPKNIGNYTSPRKLRSDTTSISTHLLTIQLDTTRDTSTYTRSMLPSPPTINTASTPGVISQPTTPAQPPAHTMT